MNDLRTIKRELKELGNPEKAKASARFFKTGKGEYSEGDVFLGVTVPEQRKIAKKFSGISLKDIECLLQSTEHEYRMTALIILVEQFKNGSEKERKQIYNFYLKNTKWVNNRDLVDTSAEHVVGRWLENRKDKMRVLRRLAKSHSVWERRIAMLATFAYIKNGESKEALVIAELLLRDTHDLIQKAVGWMLREIGKRCSLVKEERFLREHYQDMPRTTLRYAIEQFPEAKRQQYLAGGIIEKG